MIIYKILLFGIIFIGMEVALNWTFFPYLKTYFQLTEKDIEKENETEKLFYGFHISIFKGLLERFTMVLCLILGLSQVLIVFGALKIGTRFEKNEKIKNDYFLIGNFSSILIAVIQFKLYSFCLMHLSFQ
jgi:hypothetical protein